MRSSIMARRQAMLRISAGWLVATALLLQVFAAVPLRLRMADATVPAICIADPAARHDGQGAPPPSHDHAQCVICQGTPLPVASCGVAVPLPRATGPMTAPSPQAFAPPGRVGRFHYASRAPPAIG